MITDFEQARRANLAVQSWFAPEIMQFFGTRLGVLWSAPYGAYYSYTNDDEFGVRHRVAYINDAGYVNPSYTGEGSGHLARGEFTDLQGHEYDSLDEASQAAHDMARKAWGRR